MLDNTNKRKVLYFVTSNRQNRLMTNGERIVPKLFTSEFILK